MGLDLGKNYGISAVTSPLVGLTNIITLQESGSKSNKNLVTKNRFIIEAV